MKKLPIVYFKSIVAENSEKLKKPKCSSLYYLVHSV